MIFTFQQALTELTSNAAKYTSIDALIGLIRNTSADAKGAVTILYSSVVAPSGSEEMSVGSMEILNGMVANGDDIRIVDNTDAAKLVANRDFRITLSKVTGVLITDFENRGNPQVRGM